MFLKKQMHELNRHKPEDAITTHKNPIIIILDDIRSMHNVGSAFRTADAFAIHSIYLCGFTPQPPHREIHKTALGATETVNWQHFEQTKDAIIAAKEQGYKILAVEQTHGSTPLESLNWQGEAIALIFGNEVSGVSEEALKEVEKAIEIPQWGSKHSLNVSVTIGVVLWEIMRSK